MSRLIEPCLLLEAQNTDGLEQAERTESIRIRGVFGRFETHLHVTLCGEIVDLVRLRFLHETDEVRRVREIAVVEKEARVLNVGIDVDAVDAPGIERRRPALHTMYDVALPKEQRARYAPS